MKYKLKDIFILSPIQRNDLQLLPRRSTSACRLNAPLATMPWQLCPTSQCCALAQRDCNPLQVRVATDAVYTLSSELHDFLIDLHKA